MWLHFTIDYNQYAHQRYCRKYKIQKSEIDGGHTTTPHSIQNHYYYVAQRYVNVEGDQEQKVKRLVFHCLPVNIISDTQQEHEPEDIKLLMHNQAGEARYKKNM